LSDDLYNLLATLYPLESESRRVVSSAGLDSNRIDFRSQASTNWYNIIREAKNQSKVNQILKFVATEYPNNQDIRDFLKNSDELISNGSMTEFEPGFTQGVGQLAEDAGSDDNSQINSKASELDLIERLKQLIGELVGSNDSVLTNESSNRLAVFDIEVSEESLPQVRDGLHDRFNVLTTVGDNPIELDCTIPADLRSESAVDYQTSQLVRIRLLGTKTK